MKIYTVVLVALVTVNVKAYKFVSIGDWGYDNEDQYRTARGVSTWCQTNKCNAIISTGDNFYLFGVLSKYDIRFNTTWRNVYNLKGIQNKYWLICMGNHDHLGDYRAQIEYKGIEPRWHIPNLWYDETFLNRTIHIISIDTNSIENKENGYKKQIEWLEETLNNSKSTWKLVFGHHPPFAGGKHMPGSSRIRNKIVPLLEKYHVDVLLSGHDHNKQHITKKKVNAADNGWKVDYVISGAGGNNLYPKNINADKAMDELSYQFNFFEEQFGFVTFDFISNKLLTVKFIHVTDDEEIVINYSFNRMKSAI